MLLRYHCFPGRPGKRASTEEAGPDESRQLCRPPAVHGGGGRCDGHQERDSQTPGQAQGLHAGRRARRAGLSSSPGAG